MSSLAVNLDSLGMLTKALAANTGYGRDKYPEGPLDPNVSKAQFQHDALIKNRNQHGDRIAGTYGRLPALLGLVPATGYEAVKAVAMSDKHPFDVMAKDALMYVGRSPLGAAWYGAEPDAHADDPQTTEMFTIDGTTRKPTPEAVAAYGRGVMGANANLVEPSNLIDALAGVFGHGGVK